MANTKATEDLDVGFDMEIVRVGRIRHEGGRWVNGTLNGYRFDALVFPDHADHPEWEIGGDSRITKFYLLKLDGSGQISYEWDRGLNVSAADADAQAIVDFLAAGLAEHIYAK